MSGVLTAASAARAAVPPDDLELLPQHADETPGRERERVKRWRTEWHQSGHKIPKDLDDWSDEDRLSPWQWWYHELECYDLISFSRFEEFYNIELRISERLICFDAFSELCCAPREFVPYIVKCFDGRFAMHRCSDQGYYASALLVDCITLVEASAPEEMYDQRKVEFTDPWRELGEPLVHDDQRRIVLALSELTSRGYMVANGDVIRKLSTSTDAWRKYQQWIEFAQCSLGDGRFEIFSTWRSSRRYGTLKILVVDPYTRMEPTLALQLEFPTPAPSPVLSRCFRLVLGIVSYILQLPG